MAEVLSAGANFAPETVSDLFSKVTGHSTVATLSKQTPIAFNGNDVFTFSMDDEVDIVAENGAKRAGSAAVAPVKMVPIKIEYGARVSDEFMYASEEKKLDILQAFNDGAAKKIARGLDIMAFHGLNPRDKTVSAIIGNNCIDKACAGNTVAYAAATADDNIEDAIVLLDGSDADATGVAMAKTFRSALAKLTDASGHKRYPQLAWATQITDLNGTMVDVNSTVSFGGSKDMAIVGDFMNSLKWGFAKQIPLEVIPYGDPDNSGKDLKGYNQVYLRIEAYIGWGILNPAAFALVASAA